MSYAGTYGPDETCEHDFYRPNCWRCNGSVERFVQELPDRVAHAEAVAGVTVKEVPAVMYEVSCPGCGGSPRFATKEQASFWADNHAAHMRRVATDWQSDSQVMAEARRRGLLP